MPKKETRYGPNNYVRRKVKNPMTGEYVAVYGKTVAEREEKIRALEAVWARDMELAESPSFSQYAAGWFRREAGDMSARRREDVAREINKVICPVIGDKLLAELTSDDAADVMATRARLSRSAQSKTLQILRRICRAAVHAGKLAQDPTEDRRAGGKKPAPKSALTPEEERRLLEAVRGLSVELFVQLGLYTGMRREELCGLTWRDVELNEPAHINVRQACRWPKNNQPAVEPLLKSSAAWRTIPIPPALLGPLRAARGALGDLPEEQIRPLYVLGGKTPWTHMAFRRAWGQIDVRTARPRRLRRKDPATGKQIYVVETVPLGATVRNHPGVVVSLDFEVTPHKLRRTYVTRLILGGVDLKRVQYLAGHESAQVTLDIYTQIMGHRPEDLIDDVSAIFPAE